jgi:uncharacterized protein
MESMRERVAGRIFLGGHSYGGRQASMLAASQPGFADALLLLLLLSYPLHPPKKPAQPRTAHFPKLRTPALFVHGTRDGFGSLEEVTDALRAIPARTQLLPIDSAVHDLLTTHNRAARPHTIASTFQSFVESPS